MKDQEIIQLFCERQENAIDNISKKYEKYCFAISFNILHNREDAEECVNDTWLRVWNVIPPTIPEYLKIFVGKITRNLSFDRYRAKQCGKRGSGEMDLVLEELGDIVDGSEDIEQLYEYKELVDAINEYLYTISERDREIFVRRYFYVDDTRKIARMIGISEDNVLVILSRIRKKLSKYLKNRELI